MGRQGHGHGSSGRLKGFASGPRVALAHTTRQCGMQHNSSYGSRGEPAGFGLLDVGCPALAGTRRMRVGYNPTPADNLRRELSRLGLLDVWGPALAGQRADQRAQLQLGMSLHQLVPVKTASLRDGCCGREATRFQLQLPSGCRHVRAAIGAGNVLGSGSSSGSGSGSGSGSCSRHVFLPPCFALRLPPQPT